MKIVAELDLKKHKIKRTFPSAKFLPVELNMEYKYITYVLRKNKQMKHKYDYRLLRGRLFVYLENYPLHEHDK